MNYAKKRTASHVIGDQAVHMLKDLLPSYWTIRDYNNPDYGIDLSVEIFEEEDGIYYSTGEHLFLQVKGTEHLHKSNFTIRQGKKRTIPASFHTVTYPLDTALLATVQQMGSTIPVLFCLVDICTREAYVVCLNDYIEKIILPVRTDYCLQKKLQIHIPIANKLTAESDPILLRWYGKRAKCYSLFNEIHALDQERVSSQPKKLRKLLRKILIKIQAMGLANPDIFCIDTCILENPDSIEFLSSQEIFCIWRELTGSGYRFEILLREWYLPEFINCC